MRGRSATGGGEEVVSRVFLQKRGSGVDRDTRRGTEVSYSRTIVGILVAPNIYDPRNVKEVNRCTRSKGEPKITAEPVVQRSSQDTRRVERTPNYRQGGRNDLVTKKLD